MSAGMSASLPVQIQTVGGFQDQTLIMAHIAALRQSDRVAAPAHIRDAFVALRVPPPANISNYLNRLARDQLVMQVSPATWALTPLGGERIRHLMEGTTDKALMALEQIAEEPALAAVPHHLIPPELAPGQFHEGIGRFLEGHPFERNVFGISRYSRSDSDPMDQALSMSREACSQSGFEFHLASDRTVEDFLLSNVAACMWACRYGIAVLENRVGEGLNYNVVLEVGAMIATGRRCLLLKDSSCPDLPTDLVGHIYSSINLEAPETVSDAVNSWLKDLSAAP